jgi:hypothetical protein
VGRGEMPNELGDSWFSPKCIEVQPCWVCIGGRALNGLGGFSLTNPNQTANADVVTAGVRRRGLSFVVERETAQIAS